MPTYKLISETHDAIRGEIAVEVARFTSLGKAFYEGTKYRAERPITDGRDARVYLTRNGKFVGEFTIHKRK